MVEKFLQTPVPQLPPEEIEPFITINPDTLPKRLRAPYLAKRIELETLRRAYEAKTVGQHGKPRSGAACGDVIPGGAALARQMSKNLFKISPLEEAWLMRGTRCTQRELMCDFTLTVVYRKKRRKTPSAQWYFLNPEDPLVIFVSEKRSGQPAPFRGFFGESVFPTCR
ncbi:MAG: hypothetical protein KGL04_05215 [Elusimicrobia bacterium]|nr:hypothetical protein [Elusimicrobiota bacterium]